jgi:16S rRNA (adenine1518-N6/adenine1519-N6)-dimethyltransferase
MRLLTSAAEDPVALQPPLRDVIAAAELAATKALGQHFLLDLNLTGKIARQVPHISEGTIIEVGPGPGGLTRALLLAGAKNVVAIERDARAVLALQPLVTAAGGRLKVIEGDALEFDYLALPGPRQIVSNLPYNVGTPLLIGWLAQMEQFAALTLMFQKEVAQRLIAKPSTPEYGRLSVMSQWRCSVKKLFDLPARAFTPPPKVESSVVQLMPAQRSETLEWKQMERAVAAAFSQRRKMLRNTLAPLGDTEALCAEANIKPTARAEELSVADFIRLTQVVCKNAG